MSKSKKPEFTDLLESFFTKETSKVRTKHTAGPWVVAKNKDLYPDSKGAGLIVYKDKGVTEWKEHRVHSMTHICYIPDNPRGQFYQNAAVISAAPEMLAALEEFLECGPNAGHNQELIAQVKAAIAKARGES